MGSGLSNLLFILILVAVFWFVAIKPQQQRQKKQRQMLEALTAGDEIVTVGGIYGTVVAVDDRVRIRVADGSELEIALQAVAQVVVGRDADVSEPEIAEAPEATDAGVITDEDEASPDA